MKRLLMMTLLVCLLQAVRTLPCCAQDATTPHAGSIDDTHRETPPFAEMFQRLRNNILDYNKYNDSIFLIHDHNDWIQFFLRRAERHHEIYDENKRILHDVKSFFADTPQHRSQGKAYDSLFHAFEDFMNSTTSVDDAFLTLEICDILEKHFSEVSHLDSANNILRVKLWQSYAYWSVYTLTQDSLYARKSKECYQTCFDNNNKALPYYYRARFTSAINLMSPSWISGHFITLAQHMEYRKALQEMLRNDSLNAELIAPRNLRWAKSRLANDDENLARNVGIADSVSIPKQFTDSIMLHVVERNDTCRSLPSLGYYNNLLFKTYLKQIDYTEALRLSIIRYKAERSQLGTSFTDSELHTFLQKYFTICLFNDRAQISYRRKRSNVLRFCRDIIRAYQQRKEQQYATSYIRNLERLVTYDRLVKYLKPKERIDFLNKMYVATQVTTYAHCVHVAQLADVVADAVLKYRPALFCGTLGCKTVAEVKHHANDFREFVHKAAMYHDMGKNSLVSIIINECRPTTDLEYSIIKTHPERAMKYLAIAPELQRYHDTTLGHHKWYNGKGGYPADYDNTRSSVRIITDIVTLCDCMQAATEKVGRNYKKEKPYSRLLGELTKDAGTRYNPQLVNLICQHKDVDDRLHELVEDGWLEIYYNIYSQFFKQEKDEK